MPPRIRNTVTAGGLGYQDPFNGPADHTAIVKIDVTSLTSAEIDTGGFLIPGLPLTAAGAKLAPGDVVYGIVPEPIRVATSNSAADIAAALAALPVAVVTIGQVVRDAIEANLDRALTADEIAGFIDGGSLKLLQ